MAYTKPGGALSRQPWTMFAVGSFGRFEQVRAVDFFVTARREPGDNQISLFVEEEKAIAILNKKSVGPSHGLAGGRGLKRFPHALAGFRFQTAQLAVTAHAID